MLKKTSTAIGLISCFLLPMIAQADLPLTNLGQTVSIDFEDYLGAGLAPGGGSGTLNSNHWTLFLGDETGFEQTTLGETRGSGEFGRGVSAGGVSDRGYYAFETGNGNTALGIQLGGTNSASAKPSLRIQNQTGQAIDLIRVSYDIWTFNDSNNSNYFDLEFSDGTDYVDPEFFETPFSADVPAGWVKTEMMYDLMLPVMGNNGNPIAALGNGDGLWVEWSIGGEFDSLNAYDEVALDNVRITPFSSVPEPSAVLALLLAGLTLVSGRRRIAGLRVEL